MIELIDQVKALKEAERFNIFLVVTEMNETGKVSVYMDMDEGFRLAMPVLAARLKEVIVKSLPYAGYFEHMQAGERIGFADAHFYPATNRPGEFSTGVYLEILDKTFQDSKEYVKLMEVISDATIQINELTGLVLN